ncbi:unnamed protein product [Laminaria digitata]
MGKTHSGSVRSSAGCRSSAGFFGRHIPALPALLLRDLYRSGNFDSVSSKKGAVLNGKVIARAPYYSRCASFSLYCSFRAVHMYLGTTTVVQLNGSKGNTLLTLPGSSLVTFRRELTCPLLSCRRYHTCPLLLSCCRFVRWDIP